jgi:hypothetical protein
MLEGTKSPLDLVREKQKNILYPRKARRETPSGEGGVKPPQPRANIQLLVSSFSL